MIIAGLKMRNLQTYGLAITASILGLLPGSVGFIVGLPFGIWSVVVLSSAAARREFDLAAEIRADYREGSWHEA